MAPALTIRLKYYLGVWLGQPVDFFHCSDNRVQMLNDVCRVDFIEAAISERIGKRVQVVNNVDTRQSNFVHANCTRNFVSSTSDIQHLHSFHSRSKEVLRYSGTHVLRK